ncbi:sulfotransferase family 2 domain-containing protein [Celeribacter baekdonensis]|uniref:Sulfotransferase family protein n=1 Tax=Celeribacter baekdonensis TaxID=875171 RepID=A0A2R4M962_9RHOB|nr:sulfotransferase family 2 domain-containing protein [Celeribacter baekdonensis]AVW93599.1 hypothetical protein DA792_21405 [Celeribacter baekdonensis]
MVNIIREADKFVFVHIPKCGGSSIAIGLTAALDPPLPGEIRYTGLKLDTREGLGTYMDAHKPLWMLRDYFPDELAAYRNCACFAVARDPFKRFISAVQQHIREFGNSNIAEMSDAEVNQTLDHIMDHITTHRDNVGGEYVHFIPQYDYVFLDGERIVEHVYPLENLDAMATHIATVIKRFGKPLRKVMPSGLYWSVKSFVIKSMTKYLPDNSLDALHSDRVRAFVKEYYANDTWLYDEARQMIASQTAQAS